MILASRSPRRRELLSRCGVEFSVFDADVGELTQDSGVILEELPAANASLKADAAAEKFPCWKKPRTSGWASTMMPNVAGTLIAKIRRIP